jgi:hypothetical protein
MMMSVPYKVMFSYDKARDDPVLGKLLKENEHLFDFPDQEQLVLAIFLAFEWLKGE